MGSSKALVIVIMSLGVTVYGDVTRNGTSLKTYEPSQLLLKIFKPHTTQARQRDDSFKFEDYPSGPTAEDQEQYILYEDKPLKFENSDQTDQKFNGKKPLRFLDDLDQEPDQNEGDVYGFNIDDDRPFRFDDRPQIDQDENKPLKFGDGNQNRDHNEVWPSDFKHEIPKEVSPFKFQDSNPNIKGVRNENSIQGQNKKKRKRRRRKPKQLSNLPGLDRPGYQGASVSPGYQGVSVSPGYQGVPGAYQGYGAGYGYPGLQGAPLRRRPRRPRPSLASDALTAVTGALSSIALYDDYQCVPRLLCEAAGGGTLGTAGVLDSVAGLQPLLTLLSAYNGISNSPLFVFGRAVFLGMTSKGNTGTCRYAYSQCPTDPEQLIYYLNNHNGGFFRFFNAPPNQNLQQFYQHLGQNFNQNGPYPSDYYQNTQYPANYQTNQNYNQYQNQQYAPDYNQAGQSHNQNGSYPSDYNQAGLNYYQYQNNGQYQNQGGFGLFPQSMYGNQNYGQNYDYNRYSKIKFRDSKEIEDRIQNKPVGEADDQFDDEIYNDDQNDNYGSKFAFPGNFKPTDIIKDVISDNTIRDNKALRFPEYQNVQTNSNRKQKAVHFPNTNNYPNRYNKPNRIKYLNYHEFNRLNQPSYNHNNNYYHNHNDFNNNNVKYNPNTNTFYNQNNLNNNNIRQPYNHNNDNYHKYNDFNNNYNLNNNNNNYHTQNDFNNDDYYFDHKHGFYVKKENGKFNIVYNSGNNKVYDNNNAYNHNNDKDANIVYIVRGNGDPNHPEVVKLKPGQSVY